MFDSTIRTIDKFQFEINNQIYELNPLIDNDKILISIQKLNSEIKYEKLLEKENLNYFGLDDPFKNLISLLENNQFKPKIKENEIKLKFHNENNSTSFNIHIPISNIHISSTINSIENINLNEGINNLEVNNELNILKKKVKDNENKITKIDYILKKVYQEYLMQKTIFNSKIINKNDVKIIQNFINPNQINEFKLLFSTYNNNDKIEDMHKFCDNKGPTILIIKANGKIFGGYNSSNWKKNNKFINDSNSKNSFLFSLDKKEKYPLNKNYLCYSCLGSANFLLFGNKDLCIWNNCTKNNLSFCEKNSYDIPDNYEITGGEKFFKVDGFEVYLV